MEVYYKTLIRSKYIFPIMAYTKKDSYINSPGWVKNKILCEIPGVDCAPKDSIKYRKHFRTYDEWYRDCIDFILILRRLFGEKTLWIVDTVFPMLEAYMGNYIIQVFHGELFNIGSSYFEQQKIESFRRYRLMFPYGNLIKGKVIKRCGISPDDNRLHVIGRVLNNTLYTRQISRKKVLSSYHLDPTRKTILFAPTWCSRRIFPIGMGDQESINFQKLCIFAARMNANMIVRPHTILIHHYYARPKYQKIIKKFKNIYFDDTTNYSIDGPNKSLVASDVLLTDLSSISIDFMSLGKPVIFLYPDKKRGLWGDGMPTFEEVSSISYTVKNITNLYSFLSILLTKKEEHDMIERRKKFVSYALSVTNGTSGKRFRRTLDIYAERMSPLDYLNGYYLKRLWNILTHVKSQWHMRAEITQI